MQPAKKTFLTNDDMQKADDLNRFFLRFDTQNYNQECLKELSSIITSDQGDNNLLIDSNYVQSLFKQKRPKKSAGPNGISSYLLRACAEELSPVWCYIFQRSIDSKAVLAIWKKSLFIPYAKNCSSPGE